jgi:putative nucleotidyltransferase with HDIG domain
MRKKHLRLMEIILPAGVAQIANLLADAGLKVWLVGGAVRDLLSGRQPRDYDLLTDGQIPLLQEIFPRTIRFAAAKRTLLVPCQGLAVEVSSLAGMELGEELRLRDFTYNAMAVRLCDGELIDPMGGECDLRDGLLRPCQVPELCFSEDPVRLLRMLRQAHDYQLRIDPGTAAVAKASSALLGRISQERLRDELTRLLHREQGAGEGIVLWQEYGFLTKILPEVAGLWGVEQSPPHQYDCFWHTMAALDLAPCQLVLRLAALFHDVGKPPTAKKIEGSWRFYGHHQQGAAMTEQALRRLCYPEKTVATVSALVLNHMFVFEKETQDKTLNRLIRKISPFKLEDLVALRLADWLSIYPGGDVSLYDEMLARASELASSGRTAGVSQLALKGDDVMAILGITSGPRVGKILENLLAQVDDAPELNTREKLTEILRKD